jgi:hypothetical protein
MRGRRQITEAKKWLEMRKVGCQKVIGDEEIIKVK